MLVQLMQPVAADFEILPHFSEQLFIKGKKEHIDKDRSCKE